MVMYCERRILAIYRKHLGPFELTSSQFSILMVLARRGPLKQVELCVMIALEKSSASRNLQRLLGEKFLSRKADRSLEITNKGKALLERCIPSWEQAKAEVVELLGAEGEQALRGVMMKLRTQIT